MATVSEVEAGFWEQFEAFQSVSLELAGYLELDQVAERALDLALALTKSSTAFIALVDQRPDVRVPPNQGCLWRRRRGCSAANSSL